MKTEPDSVSAPVQPGARPQCPKCGKNNFHIATKQRVRCFGCFTDYEIEGVESFAQFFPVAAPSAPPSHSCITISAARLRDLVELLEHSPDCAECTDLPCLICIDCEKTTCEEHEIPAASSADMEQVDEKSARAIIAELISSPQFYETYEKAMAPGIADGWPDIIPAPHTKNGRLYKVETESLVEKLIESLRRRVPQSRITTAGELRERVEAATAEEKQPLIDALHVAMESFGSEDLEEPATVPATPEPWIRRCAEAIVIHAENCEGQIGIDSVEGFISDYLATTQGTPEGKE